MPLARPGNRPGASRTRAQPGSLASAHGAVSECQSKRLRCDPLHLKVRNVSVGRERYRQRLIGFGIHDRNQRQDVCLPGVPTHMSVRHGAMRGERGHVRNPVIARRKDFDAWRKYGQVYGYFVPCALSRTVKLEIPNPPVPTRRPLRLTPQAQRRNLGRLSRAGGDLRDFIAHADEGG